MVEWNRRSDKLPPSPKVDAELDSLDKHVWEDVRRKTNTTNEPAKDGTAKVREANKLQEEFRVGIKELRVILEDVRKKQECVLQRLGIARENEDHLVHWAAKENNAVSLPYDRSSISDQSRSLKQSCVSEASGSRLARNTQGAPNQFSLKPCVSQANGPNLIGHASEQSFGLEQTAVLRRLNARLFGSGTDVRSPSEESYGQEQTMINRLTARMFASERFASLRSVRSGHKTESLIKRMRKSSYFGNMHADASSLDQAIYDVSAYYSQSGLFQMIARSDFFNNVTLAVIALNTIYIGIDTDRNPANFDADTDPPQAFILSDFLFCCYFSFEWFMRFFSFRRKLDCMKDVWFRFDTILVVLMVWETWIMPLFYHSSAGPAVPTGMIKMVRLLRLARMARLLRFFPELLHMIKGVRMAAKAVWSALLLLLLLVYTFAIVMFIQLHGNPKPELAKKFETLVYSMWTMLCHGVFLDSFGTVVFLLLGENRYLEVFVFFSFALASNLIVMNMLVGVLCQVVSNVAAAEEEEAVIKLMRETLLVMLKNLDADGSGMITKKEMSKVFDDVDAQIIFSELAVDVHALIEQLDMVFSGSPTGEVAIQEVMNFILMLRGERAATVKDITHGQLVTHWRLKEDRKELIACHRQLAFLIRELGLAKAISTGNAEEAEGGCTSMSFGKFLGRGSSNMSDPPRVVRSAS